VALPSSFTLVRADDHVVLEVFPTNLVVQPTTPSRDQPSPYLLRAATAGARLRVWFPQQEIIEYASPVTGVRKRQPMPIFSPRTDVVVVVPVDDPGVPLSVAGILDALDRLPLEVDGTLGTRFSFPHLLAMRPAVPTRLRHRSRPVSHDGRTELWHSTLERVTPDPAEPFVPMELDAVPRTATSANSAVVNDLDINNAFKLGDWANLAAAAAAEDAPALVDRLQLSSLGAWLDLRGSWASLPDVQHHIDLGRDSGQRKVEIGRLYPFGHAAILTSDTVRAFETTGAAGNPTGRAAVLRTVSVITVLEPTRTFPYDVGTGANVGWPFASVTVGDRRTPRGDRVTIGTVTVNDLAQNIELLEVPGPPSGNPGQPLTRVPFAFSCTAVDRSGQTATFTMPMLFVPAKVPDSQTLAAIYNQATQSGLRDLDLGGQSVGVAPEADATGAVARASGDAAERATAVLASQLVMRVDAAGRPLMTAITGKVNALERYGAGTATFQYAQPFLDDLFAGANAQGQVFLQLAQEQALALGKEATAGLASLDLPIGGLSREFGALAATRNSLDPDQTFEKQLARLAAGELDLSFLDAVNKLFGVVPLKALIPSAPKLKLGKNQKITTTVVDGVATTELVLDTPLLRGEAGDDKPFREGFVGLAPFRRNPSDPHDTVLHIEQTTSLDTATGTVSSVSICKVTSISLQLFATSKTPDPDDPRPDDDTAPLVTVPFVSITFTSRDGDKPEVDVDLGPVRFGGFLAFLGVLAELIDEGGFIDPPALAVDESGIRSTFEFPIPSVAVGMFALENIGFGAALKLPFTDDPLTLALSFARRDNPFALTVAMLGGGGYLEIELSTAGLQRIAGSLEFGARLSIDLFIAKASVEAMGGVYANYVKDQGIDVVAFFRIRGELEVLSLVSVSVTFTLALEYQSAGNQLFGRGELAVNITVLFFSETVVVEFERRFAGRNADPTFAELMAPSGLPAGSPTPWDAYCLAFAAVA
jgi:hypothetical protein